MFVIEPMLKLIHSEAKANVDVQHQEQLQSYQAALAQEAAASESKDEATSA